MYVYYFIFVVHGFIGAYIDVAQIHLHTYIHTYIYRYIKVIVLYTSPAFVGSLFVAQKDIDRATVKNSIPLKQLKVFFFFITAHTIFFVHSCMC